MAKKQGKTRPAGTEKKLTLQRNAGHRREAGASLACYQYQKEELKRRARRGIHIGGGRYRPCSVSFYLNHLLWKDEISWSKD